MHDYKKGEVLRSGSATNGTYWHVNDLTKGNFIVLERLQWSKDVVGEPGVMRRDGHVIRRKIQPGGLILLEKNRGLVERHEKCKSVIVKD
jgi:hypothetical protein